MPAKIDRDATATIDFPCPCDGSPHEVDSVTIRSQYGYGDLLDVQASAMRYVPVKQDDGTVTLQSIHDSTLEHYALLEMAVQSWTFLDGTEPLPVTPAAIRALRPDIGEAIATEVNGHYLASIKGQTLPNPSSGQSQPSSLASLTASPNRAQRRAAKRSTSKSSS